MGYRHLLRFVRVQAVEIANVTKTFGIASPPWTTSRYRSAGFRVRLHRPQRIGKITTMRMIVNIFGSRPRPHPPARRPRSRACPDLIGYLPEEPASIRTSPVRRPDIPSTRSFTDSSISGRSRRASPMIVNGLRRRSGGCSTVRASKPKRRRKLTPAARVHNPMNGIDPRSYGAKCLLLSMNWGIKTHADSHKTRARRRFLFNCNDDGGFVSIPGPAARDSRLPGDATRLSAPIFPITQKFTPVS